MCPAISNTVTIVDLHIFRWDNDAAKGEYMNSNGNASIKHKVKHLSSLQGGFTVKY